MKQASVTALMQQAAQLVGGAWALDTSDGDDPCVTLTKPNGDLIAFVDLEDAEWWVLWVPEQYAGKVSEGFGTDVADGMRAASVAVLGAYGGGA